MRLRIRGPEGQKPITLPYNASISDLKVAISQATSLNSFDVKYGYPPKTLDLASHQDKDSIEGLKLDGEQLIISETVATKQSSQPVQVAPAKSQETKSVTRKAAPLSLERKKATEDPPEIPMPHQNSTMVLRIMPDDNSCLFRAVNAACLNGMDNMHELRSLVAQAIQADKDTYSEIVLEKEPDKYCQWIQNPDAWGGAIELQILSKELNVEICSIDVQTLRVDRYNEGMSDRCILVYSGIHYDVIALSPSDPPHDIAYNPPEHDTKIFPCYDESIVTKAVELCKGLQGQGYFTDTAGFNVKCNTCGGVFKGQKGAVAHANETGHIDFGEA